MAHVCPWQCVRTFDNLFRPLAHNPAKIFGPFVKPGMQVMDVGCGAGFATIGLARLVGDTGKVHAVDLQAEMLEMVRKRAVRQGLERRIVLHRCGPETVNVNRTFQFVNAFYMVHEVPDTRAFLRDIHGQMASDGRFLVAEPIFHVSRQRFSQMMAVAGDLGFQTDLHPRIRFSRAVVFRKGP